jgi:hypothetical protein
MQDTVFSLIIPFPSDLRLAKALAESLKLLPASGAEVILVGPARPGPMRADLEKAADARKLGLSFCDDPGQDSVALMDQALTRSLGSIICLLPPGCVPAPTLVRALEQFQDDPALAALAGEMRPSPALADLAHLSVHEEEYYGESGLACLAMRKDAALQAGGLSAPPGQPSLPERLASLGRSMTSDPELAAFMILPGDWSGIARRQFNLGMSLFNKRLGGVALNRLHHRNLLLQQLLIIVLIALQIGFLPHDPSRALSLGLICVLLLYPLNRGFLKHSSSREPGLINQALLFCLIRPFLRLAGGIYGALSRFF